MVVPIKTWKRRAAGLIIVGDSVQGESTLLSDVWRSPTRSLKYYYIIIIIRFRVCTFCNVYIQRTRETIVIIIKIGT